MMATDIVGVGAGLPTNVAPDDPDFREQVLACYKPHCRYVQSFRAERGVLTADAAGSAVTGRCQMSVPEPCYIDATGHLNAVDVGICFNQALYLAIGTSVRWGWLPEFAEWGVADFFAHQLADVLIAETTAKYSKPISPQDFSAVFRIESATKVASGTVWLATNMECTDARGGQCVMTASVAVVNA